MHTVHGQLVYTSTLRLLAWYSTIIDFCTKLHILRVYSIKYYACLIASESLTNLATQLLVYIIGESFTLFSNSVFTPVGSNRFCDQGKYTKLYYEEDHVCGQ